MSTISCCLKFLVYFLVFISIDVLGQNERSPLLKIGGFVYFTHSEYSGFSANFEYERTWRKESFTSGPRLDYTFTKNLGYTYTGDIGPKLYLGYELKFYPFYQKYKSPYRGIFLGIEPLILTKRPNNDSFRYGPGVGALAGYQYIFNDKISLSFEGSVVYFQNLNEDRAKKNPQDRYFSTYVTIKVGIRL
jgi:hypothetical protein